MKNIVFFSKYSLLHPCTCELSEVCYTNPFFVNSRSWRNSFSQAGMF